MPRTCSPAGSRAAGVADGNCEPKGGAIGGLVGVAAMFLEVQSERGTGPEWCTQAWSER